MWRRVPWLTFTAMCLLPFAWVAFIDHGAWRQRHTIGLLVLLPSAILWAWSRAALGPSFTTGAEARTLVTSGPYARIQHPIYLFAELATLGFILFIGYPWLLATFAITVPLQVRRARRERAVLELAFGERYRAYRRSTWF